MSRILSDLAKKFSRLFFGRIVVRTFEQLHRPEPTKIRTHFHHVGIHAMRPEARIGAALFVKWKTSKAKSSGGLIGEKALKNFKVYRVDPAKVLKKSRVIRYKLNIKSRAQAKNALNRIKRTPILRGNRLSFLKKHPTFEKASLLALYSPIYREKVIKSALDKSTGNLLFWYDNERVKIGEKSHLLLLRVYGGEEPLKWVWLPADKKLD